jgi:hypothetical protein
MPRTDYSVSSSLYSGFLLATATLLVAEPSLNFFINNIIDTKQNINDRGEHILSINPISDYENLEIRNTHNDTKISLVLGEDSHMIIIDRIKGPEFTLEFVEPLAFNYKIEDGAYYFDYEAFAIYSYGETLDELKECFKEDVIAAWEMFVECNVDELTQDALEVRKNLLSFIRKV